MSINRQAIAAMQRELQREFDKRPIRVPLNVDSPGVPPQTVNHYHAPVVTVHGGHAQVAWGDGDISQQQFSVSDVTEGYEALAQSVATVLAQLDRTSLSADEAADFRDGAEAILAEVTNAAPDRTVLRRGLALLKGLLASAATGVNTAVSAESAEFAREAIEKLSAGLAS